ncbi:ribose ABC transporter [Thermoanaerobacterium sp. PSU-2]|uniref:sugar ABC transporter ATP-binding protein n=1 Tax=Thermoanaerobacterium sp. PSU-2 TaxID=1930849 RepID=UPI000A14F7E5|nr:ribose ABC transporter [Thermoanaerobacterium sp. PSU-2]
MKEEILRVEKLNKYFGSNHVVKDATLSFKRGEIHGLIGENGSGKSTLVSMISGIYEISSGKIFLEDREIKVRSLVEANRNGISIIVQEAGTILGLTVAENIFLGNEEKFIKHGIKNIASMNKEAQELLERYECSNINATDLIDKYNFEERKLIEIIKAIYIGPKVFIVDETTTALSQSGRELLYKQMTRIKEEGNTVIFITHDLDELIKWTDRITVMRDGVVVDTVDSDSVTEDDIKRLMVGRELSGHYYRTDYEKPIFKETVLKLSNVTVPGQFDNISFELHKGEILGIGGLSECGMHEVGKAIFGASFNRLGDVILRNEVKINSIEVAIKNGIAYVSKDRDNESLIVNDTISDNICITSLDDLKEHNIIFNGKLSKFANKYAEVLSVKMENVNQLVSDLSGGNKQKVALARWIAKNSEIFILDSPTRGIDVKVKADIYDLMTEMKNQGKSILLISEEILELIGMCDRILIMKNGKINGEFMRDINLTEEDLIMKMI